MNGLTRRLVSIFLIFPIFLNGQNTYLDKKVIIQKGKFTLKAALKNLSNQTGCVFSYDPTKIIDKQEITISSKKSLTLQSSLQKILPKQIQFKLNGKYVVLQKIAAATIPVNENPVKNQLQQHKINPPSAKLENKTYNLTPTLAKNTNDSSIPEIKIDTVSKQIVIASSHPESLVRKDTASVQKDIEKESLNSAQPIQNIKSDTIKTMVAKFNPPKKILELELAANNHLAIVSTHIGVKNLYGIISLGSDYYQSYHMGIGVGTNFQLYKRLGMNIDLTQFALAAGKSRKVNIKAYTTQISPELNYSIGNRVKIFIGTSAYVIKSKYSKGTSTTDLGRYVGVSGIAGIIFKFQTR